MIYNCEITFLHLRHGTKYTIQYNIETVGPINDSIAAAMARRIGTLHMEREIRERYRGQEFMGDYGFLAVVAKLDPTAQAENPAHERD